MASSGQSFAVDPEFQKIPKDSTGFYIWRVEKLNLIPVPIESYGDFYSGDAYVVFSATNQGDKGGVDVKPQKFTRSSDIRVHFWLGADCSVDERTCAAFKTVELDGHFDDLPVQHREAQGSESIRFVSYFPKGIRYLKGGVNSGLRVADEGFRPRLFIVKGAKAPVVRELPAISWEVMNDGDAFVLDAGQRIFVYKGKNANRKELFEAQTIATLFKDELGEKIVTVEDGLEDVQLAGINRELFETYLSLSKKKLAPHTDFHSDSHVDQHERASVRLFNCSDESGKIKITQIGKDSDTPMRKDLNSNDCFLIDAGRTLDAGIWVWVGKKATDKERDEAMKYSTEFIKQQNYDDRKVAVARVVEGAEPFEFKALFGDQWR
ncbi:hypothetical protein RvY_04622 [Ramazzottius varieornatus]|uniref:Gelsolin-like domain-containing protein n=1 Tax=Ramazzottius varieornatus TaxID=947166 RepID=A0A1D1UYY0_RAMVA|nr:hypothetical protein RvY_04622 [Ramazzottius varieornatus]